MFYHLILENETGQQIKETLIKSSHYAANMV